MWDVSACISTKETQLSFFCLFFFFSFFSFREPGECDETAEQLRLMFVCFPSGPLEDGLEEEEEECVSEGNELLAKDEFSAEENFSAEFEPENMGCEDMEYFCSKGERRLRWQPSNHPPATGSR